MARRQWGSSRCGRERPLLLLGCAPRQTRRAPSAARLTPPSPILLAPSPPPPPFPPPSPPSPPPLQALEDAGYTLTSSDILRHNLVVFRNGEGALGVLPPLLDVVPEARANLAVYHLRGGRLADAAALVEDMVPSCAAEHLLKAAVAASLGQLVLLGRWSGAPGAAVSAAAACLKGAHPKEVLKAARGHFEAVGTSASEKDTIPGRQAMALSYFIRHQFEDCLLYLGSIKQYLPEAGDFLWNYGVALAARGRYAEAEEALLAVRSGALAGDPLLGVWLARCHCMCRRARAAWELYLRRSEGEGGGGSGAALALLLRTIAVDAYATGQFFYSALAYDALEKLEPGDGEVWAGKLGACAGVLQAVAAGAEAKESLREVYSLLQMSMAAAAPGGLVHRQADALTKAMQRWAQAQKEG
jgi:intraflagellar transport protein 56